MVEYKIVKQNRINRAVANCESRHGQLKKIVDNRSDPKCAIQLENGCEEMNSGNFKYQFDECPVTEGQYLDIRTIYERRIPEKNVTGAIMDLTFEPNPQNGFELDTHKIGFVQIIKKTGDVDSNIFNNNMGKFKSEAYKLGSHEQYRTTSWARIIRTADNGYRIDSQSNTPYYGSKRCGFVRRMDMELSSQNVETANPKHMEFGYYYLSDGCCGGHIKKKNAKMHDAPKSFVDELGSKSEFETRAFDMNNNKCLGGVEWGYEINSIGKANLLPVRKIQDATNRNYNGAVDQWNRLKMVSASAFPENNGQVLSPNGEPASGGASPNPNDFCPIFQVSKIE